MYKFGTYVLVSVTAAVPLKALAHMIFMSSSKRYTGRNIFEEDSHTRYSCLMKVTLACN